MGVVYESIIRHGSAPQHATITLYSSSIGTLSYLAYVCLYLLPHRRWNGNGMLTVIWTSWPLSSWPLPAWALWLGAFAVLYNVHVYVQGKTFRSDGALGVQLVNAVRGCTTNLVFFLLGERWRRGSGTIGVVSGVLAGVGGVLWIEEGESKAPEKNTSTTANRKGKRA